MEDVVKRAKDLQGMYGRRTILFIDEIHRFNKGQQDYLLPICRGWNNHFDWRNDRKPIFWR